MFMYQVKTFSLRLIGYGLMVHKHIGNKLFSLQVNNVDRKKMGIVIKVTPHEEDIGQVYF
jgi:hypothetical protein